MAFVLPFWTQPALDFYGLNWPDIDEDKVAEIGDQIKNFCESMNTFVDGVEGATGKLASYAESKAFTTIDDVVTQFNATWVSPLEQVGPVADEGAQLAADGIVAYKGAILGALLFNAGTDIMLIASGVGIPAAIAKKVITRELLQLALEEVKRQFIAQVVTLWNEQIDTYLLKPIEDLATAIADEISSAATGIVGMAINPSNFSLGTSALVVELADVEDVAKKIRTGYDGVESSLTSLFKTISALDFTAEGTPAPDPHFRLEWKAAVDWAIEAFTSKLKEELGNLVNGIIDSVIKSFQKYVEADELLCAQAETLKDEFMVPPPDKPFVIDRSTRPAPVYWAPAGSPVVTGAGTADVQVSMVTWDPADGPVVTGAGTSEASHNLRIILELTDVEPVVTGAGESAARDNIQQIVLPDVEPVVTGAAVSTARDNIKHLDLPDEVEPVVTGAASSDASTNL